MCILTSDATKSNLDLIELQLNHQFSNHVWFYLIWRHWKICLIWFDLIWKCLWFDLKKTSKLFQIMTITAISYFFSVRHNFGHWSTWPVAWIQWSANKIHVWSPFCQGGKAIFLLLCFNVLKNILYWYFAGFVLFSPIWFDLILKSPDLIWFDLDSTTKWFDLIWLNH